MEKYSKNILVAPLNWGLGHATRCIPIIKALEREGFTPIIASDGAALEMIRKEFHHLQTLELPSYQIEYSKKAAFFKWKLIKSSPKMIGAILKEKKRVAQWVQEYRLDGIISDNRLGVYNSKIPSVFITHQLNVLTGNTSWISSKLHQRIIKKHHECWVPDTEKTPNLSGKLGHLNHDHKLNIKYIGPLSRLQKRDVPKKYDLVIILSGPEPQRSILENQLQGEIPQFDGKVLFIKGVLEQDQKSEVKENVTYYNYMNASEIEQAFNESDLVLCRSGYTTIMDLAHLEKKAFFIPTPGQYEQEYLARKLKREGIAPFAKQDQFNIEKLSEIKLYKGFRNYHTQIDWEELFLIFKITDKQNGRF